MSAAFARAVGARPLYLALALGLGDAFPLALKHYRPLELGDATEHVEHELAGRRGGVEIDRQNAEGRALGLNPPHDAA